MRKGFQGLSLGPFAHELACGIREEGRAAA